MLPVENHNNKQINKPNFRNVIRTSENWKTEAHTESKITEDQGTAEKSEAYISYS